jgi:hypothetical protein
MERPMWRTMGVAAIVLAVVGTASHEMAAQSKKATTPTEVQIRTLGPVRYTPPPTANLRIAGAPTGWCYTNKNCPDGANGLAANKPIDKETCKLIGGMSWKQVAPTAGACQNL